jgi:hypothetical protein
LLGSWLGLLVASACTSCSDVAHFDVKLAPGTVTGSTSIAVLGVFRGGRLDRAAWADVAPSLLAAFPQGTCAVAFSNELERGDADLYAQIDALAKAEGVSDEVVELVAPHTAADVLLVVYVHDPVGLAPSATEHLVRPKPKKNISVPQPLVPKPLELSASFFAVRDHRSLGKLAMSYSGNDFNEALRLFSKRFAETVAGSTCVGFRWNG